MLRAPPPPPPPSLPQKKDKLSGVKCQFNSACSEFTMKLETRLRVSFFKWTTIRRPCLACLIKFKYLLSLVYIQHMTISCKEPCFFHLFVSSKSPETLKKSLKKSVSHNNMIMHPWKHALWNKHYKLRQVIFFLVVQKDIFLKYITNDSLL